MPATFPTTNLSHGPYSFSLYATLSTAAQTSFSIALSTPLASDGSVAGTLSGAGTFTAGRTQTVSATMNAGFAFASWSDSSGILSTSSTYTFTLVKNMSLTMNWVVTKSPIIAGGGSIIPADRITTWQPGLNYNGGIPSGRTQSGSTINPQGQVASFTGSTTNGSGTLTVSGVTGSLAAGQVILDAALTTCFGFLSGGSGGSWTFNDGARMTAASISMVAYGDDTGTINAAIAAAASNTFVKLANGTFNIVGNAVHHAKNNVTLRGSSQWTGKEITSGFAPSLTQTATTILWKADHQTNPFGCLYVGGGNNAVQWTGSINFALDGTKGTKTANLVSPYGGSIGDLVLIDMVGNADPNVFWGNRNDLSGYFTGSLNGTSLTVSAPLNGPTGVDGAFNGTFSGTSLTVNSTGAVGYIRQLGITTTAVGVSIFDASNTYYGYITAGAYPNFTLSQSNSGATKDLVLGGFVPLLGPIFDGVFSTFYGFIASGTYPNFTMGQSNPTLTSVTLTVGGGSRRFFCRQDRPLSQMMRVAGISGNSVTFETPFHIDFKTTYAAQISNFTGATCVGIGIEDLTLYWGVGGDGNGNSPMSACALSWYKNVQSHYSEGTGIGFYNNYRCQATQCYMHETPSPNPGGGGYLCGMNSATADCLFEDNEMWLGNKCDVMRGTGGGNVIGYCYMDDLFGGGYPMSPEAGLNAGHFGIPHMELLEGNYTHRYAGDAFWGNSIYITAHRNWITGLRAAANIHTSWFYTSLTTSAGTAAGNNTLHFNSGDTQSLYAGLRLFSAQRYGVFSDGTVITSVTATTVVLNNNVTGPGVTGGDAVEFWFDGTLNNYVLLQSGTTFPYIDSWGRNMVSIAAHSFYTNLTGNVLGYSGEGFLGFDGYLQTSFVYENLGTTFAPNGSNIEGYSIGVQQDPNQNVWLANQDATILRQGNYDFITNSQRWHGIGGTSGSGSIVSIPTSYYTGGVPAFFVSNTWPWVDPSTGVTHTLPAKDRFIARYGLAAIPPGNQ